jgi:hypothetical protein
MKRRRGLPVHLLKGRQLLLDFTCRGHVRDRNVAAAGQRVPQLGNDAEWVVGVGNEMHHRQHQHRHGFGKVQEFGHIRMQCR